MTRLLLTIISTIAVAASPLAACYGQEVAGSVPPAAPVSSVDQSHNQNQSQGPELQTREPRYIIHREDVLTLKFPIAPEMNQTVTVQPDGFVNLSGAKSVHVEGLTVPQAVDALKAAYSSTLRDPMITIDVKDFQKPLFTVTGQVGKPGQYELRQTTTIIEAIAVAGGLQPTSTTHIYLFHHTPSGSFNVEKLDLKDVLNGKKVAENSEIRAGDMLVIPESNLTKFKKVVPYSLGAYFNPSY
jgi:polysaccharide biosynthesis/export protein